METVWEKSGEESFPPELHLRRKVNLLWFGSYFIQEGPFFFGCRLFLRFVFFYYLEVVPRMGYGPPLEFSSPEVHA